MGAFFWFAEERSEPGGFLGVSGDKRIRKREEFCFVREKKKERGKGASVCM